MNYYSGLVECLLEYCRLVYGMRQANKQIDDVK